MSPDLPTVLRNKLVALIKSLRGPQISPAERVDVFKTLNEHFCLKCGEERREQCACGPITVAEAEEILKLLIKGGGFPFRPLISVPPDLDKAVYERFAALINKRVMT